MRGVLFTRAIIFVAKTPSIRLTSAVRSGSGAGKRWPPSKVSTALLHRQASTAPSGAAAAPRRPQESGYPLRMIKLIVRWLLLAAALLLVAYLYPGVTVASFGAAMIAAFVLGLLNTIVRPLLVLLTLPVTLITLGLFLFVINALMFWAAAYLLNGFNVTGFAAALIGSLIYSLCGMVIDVAVERIFAGGARA
jgi:putative membrane protein